MSRSYIAFTSYVVSHISASACAPERERERRRVHGTPSGTAPLTKPGSGIWLACLCFFFFIQVQGIPCKRVALCRHTHDREYGYSCRVLFHVYCDALLRASGSLCRFMLTWPHVLTGSKHTICMCCSVCLEYCGLNKTKIDVSVVNKQWHARF